MIPLENPDSGKTRLLNKSLTQLGWGLIQKALADRTVSPVTADRCHSLLPRSDFDSAQKSLEETSEMVALLESGDPFPLNFFADVHPLLREASEKRILAADQCLKFLKLLRLCRTLRKTLEKKDDAPLLQSLSLNLDPLTPL